MELLKYYNQQAERVSNNYSKSKHKGFNSKFDLSEWFIQELKKNDCKCYYCKTSIFDIEILINAKLLKERKIGYGFRGKVLEIDKNDEFYSKDKCVLSCYYCNNDKSYTSSKEDYKEYFGKNRHQYFKALLDKLKNASIKS